jgi:hypothetical protein|nr:MAG TPA: Type II site-specific deoxyribonuclease [Caudoviricetes sp.]
MLGKEMLLLASGKLEPLTENNLIVQPSEGNGYCYVTDALGKKFTIYVTEGDQMFSVTFPVTILYHLKWMPEVEAISNASLRIMETPGAPPGYGDVVVTPIDLSKPAIIDIHTNY